MFADFDIQQFVSALVILFAIMNTLGTVPVVLNLRAAGKVVHPGKVALATLITCVVFFYGGEAFLHLFGVNIESFAVAGAIILFIIAIGMTMDIDIGRPRQTAQTGEDATMVPVVFPLIAGSGTITTIVAIRAQYAPVNILLALAVNAVVVYVVLASVDRIAKHCGSGVISSIEKLSGIILLTIAVKLFTTNLTVLVEGLEKAGGN
ncbi:MAG: MarC family protein [Planctomycetota bacterium]|jgi:multiple antibiotic resistance protein|nr:MarC family protein [Planctomycetota bacterium]